jgi:hypothetical protein
MDLLLHRRLTYVGMRNLHKHKKDGHILGLMNVAFEKERHYGAYQTGKQVKAQHHDNNKTLVNATYGLVWFNFLH